MSHNFNKNLKINLKIAGIVCEYNPLHNGHVHHIRETQRHGATHIIAVLSDNFVQRGDAAVLHKFDRARLAIQSGVDLVLELPVLCSCAPAEVYASGAVGLLQKLNILDMLSFGCSVEDPRIFREFLEISDLILESHSEELREFLKSGYSYPASVSKLCRIYHPEHVGLLDDPNNLLGLEYVRAMRKLHCNWEILTIPRQQVSHDSPIPGKDFASASYLREVILKKNNLNFLNILDHYMPESVQDVLEIKIREKQLASLHFLEQAILYRLRVISESELLQLPDMTPSLAGRFLKYRNVLNLEEFFRNVRTKCFTMARIRRILVSMLLDLQQREVQQLRENPPYVRILALNQKGSELLRILRETSEIPLGTSLRKLSKLNPQAEKLAGMEYRTAQIYSLAQEQMQSPEREFTEKIIKL
ncbi:MAG: nucleotidyltransferase family protein [Oscillospiraceae bacterium]|nr:nucleotidyltransferase family protein [Oscillospiraceae bacterium]